MEAKTSLNEEFHKYSHSLNIQKIENDIKTFTYSVSTNNSTTILCK